MASRFSGRDYSTLRAEIIEFLRTRLPSNWDYTNLADPVVIFAESLARTGDQLHYTIDELRRECDVATAKRASSIYSYAMREGYKMFLPRASFGTLSINTIQEQDGLLHLNLKQFDEITVNPLGESLYVVNSDPIDADLHAPVDSNYVTSLKQYVVDEDNAEVTETNRKKAMTLYQSYFNDIYNKTQHVKVVLGTKSDFPFTYNDINDDSTIELPNPFIDRNLVRLSYSNSYTGTDPGTGLAAYKQLTYVDDVISSGFEYKSFTLTPKFIGGAVTLCIEFPTNYRDIFSSDISTKFIFEYINTKDSKIDPLDEYQDNADAISFPDGAITVVSGHEDDTTITEEGIQYRVGLGDGIKGYTEYENALTTRDNYKRFVQSYSALLTKDDYTNYIKSLTHSYCKVYDHSDMYKLPAVLPSDSDLIPRAIYILTDSNYEGRESLWNDLKERSSRSDCIVMLPFGKDPYTIVVKAECYLVGTSIASISTQIEQALVMYYDGLVGEKIPKISMINYLVHNASDKVIRMESSIIRDSTFGTIDTTFNTTNQLDNDQIDTLYTALQNGVTDYKSPLTDAALDATDTDQDYRYLLRGILYEDENGNFYTQKELDDSNSKLETAIITAKHYYNKYPLLTYRKYDSSSDTTKDTVASEYEDYPETFPKIYYINQESHTEEVNNYEDLIMHQITYGELDSEDWDIVDTSIYNLKNDTEKTTDIVITVKDSTDDITGKAYLPVEDTNLWTKSDSDSLQVRDYKSTDPIGSTGISVNVTYKISDNLYQDETIVLPYSAIIKDIEIDGVKRIVGEPTIDSSTTIPVIKPSYIQHHYMTPVLNKVIVLIKSVSKTL